MSNTSFSLNGTTYIDEEIKKAVENESRTAAVSGNWIIDSPVRIPSNFTLILEDCHLRMADGCFSNLFVNEHHDTELAGQQRERIATFPFWAGAKPFWTAENTTGCPRKPSGKTAFLPSGKTIWCFSQMWTAFRSPGSPAVISGGGR